MLSRLCNAALWSITCWERADLLALVGDVYCIFVTIPCGILGQVWYLILSFLDLCRLSYIVLVQNSFQLIKCSSYLAFTQFYYSV